MLEAERAPFGRCLRLDAVAFAANRGERFNLHAQRDQWVNVARLLLRSGEFQAMSLYRFRCLLHAWRVPIVPRMLHAICLRYAKLDIDIDARIEPGIYVPHGAVKVRGATAIASGCVLTPWVTLEPLPGEARAPIVEEGVFVGAHATVRGPIRIGRAAQIGAGALVVDDVPAHAVVTGVPARVVGEESPGRLERMAGQREVAK